MSTRRHLAFTALLLAACYQSGDGVAPPPNSFYYPVGMAVSRGGNVLYAANSDFDLQWNGGTVQSYDLHQIRRDAVLTIADPTNPNVPYISRPAPGACPSSAPTNQTEGNPTPLLRGQTCAPPVDSTKYVRDSATIGAFATDLQMSVGGSRIFMPVRGDASITWGDVALDDPNAAPRATDTKDSYPPFSVNCGTRDDTNRCDAAHHAGNNPFEAGNTRNIAMPGEPFGMTFSDDGGAIAVTHQSTQETSLFLSGLTTVPAAQSNDPLATTLRPTDGPTRANPSLQFVLEGVAAGGTSLVSIPHDVDAFPACSSTSTTICIQPPRPAFLETSRASAEIDLLRYYTDQAGGTTPQSVTPSSVHRPFLIKESVFPLTVNSLGTDSRDIVIDTTPRIQCKIQVPPASATRTAADVAADIQTCARIPARVFFTNRTPNTLVVGEVGETSTDGDGTYDPDKVVLFGNLPLEAGASRLYLAPVVASDGKLALRLFVVCFDSALVFVYDPDSKQMENVIRVGDVGGVGPFAMAFDPFSMEDVARRLPVVQDPRDPDLDLKKYRFAYLASFTESFVQVLDLDGSRPDKSTYEQVVFNLGSPTPPKGSTN
jgi:hypothetical protein